MADAELGRQVARGSWSGILGPTWEDTVNVADLTNLYDYGYWANAKLFAVLSELTPFEQVGPRLGHLVGHRCRTMTRRLR